MLSLFRCFRAIELRCILFAHDNLAFRVGNFLWRVRRKTLAVVILQQGFPTQLPAKKCAPWMLNYRVRRVWQ
jgi:hypothetical protein